MAELPDWVLKHKKKGMAVEKRGNSYYLTRVTSVWDPEKKRARKVTLEYLGRITPEGVIPPRGKRPSKIGGILDAGNFLYLKRFTGSVEEALAECFPTHWQSIIASACIKLCYGEPLRRFQIRHETSLSKRLWPEASLSKNSLTYLLDFLGSRWPLQREFFSIIARSEKHMAIDLSYIFSESKHISWLEYGYNSDDVWRPQVGILLMWGTTTHTPGSLKLLPGSVHSSQALINAIWESGIQEVIAVVDKGFWSRNNMEALEKANIEYIMALRRDLPMLNYVSHSRYRNYFRYNGRVEWWRSESWDGRTIYYYLDKEMYAEEESTYLRKIEDGMCTMAQFRSLKRRFGTLALLTDTGLSAEKTYELYKTRREIEYAFDTLMNTLGTDTTWMRSRIRLQGYLFIQFIALYLYSMILQHLKRKDLLKKYSVKDILTILSKVNIVEVDGEDRFGEITRQTKNIIKLLEIPITKKL
jgi:transposase